MKAYLDISDASIVKALAHPIRVRILGILEHRVASPSELATELDASLGLVSYHVRTLERLGVIKLAREARRRGAIEHYYRVVERARITDRAWASAPDVVKRATLAAHLDHVATHVNAAASHGGFDLPNVHLTRTPLTLDSEGFDEVAQELSGLLERVRDIEKQSARRLAKKNHADQQDANVVIMLFGAGDPADAAPSSKENGAPPSTRRASRASTAARRT